MTTDNDVRRGRTALLGGLRELSRFVGVGVVAYCVDTGLFNLAVYGWQWNGFAAKVLATVLATSIAFAGNRFWTWRDRPRAALHREYLWYFGFNAVGLGINLMWVGGYEWALDRWPDVFDNPIALNLVVNVAGVGFASLFRFYAYRTWVFGRPTRDPSHGGPSPPRRSNSPVSAGSTPSSTW